MTQPPICPECQERQATIDMLRTELDRNWKTHQVIIQARAERDAALERVAGLEAKNILLAASLRKADST